MKNEPMSRDEKKGLSNNPFLQSDQIQFGQIVFVHLVTLRDVGGSISSHFYNSMKKLGNILPP